MVKEDCCQLREDGPWEADCTLCGSQPLRLLAAEFLVSLSVDLALEMPQIKSDKVSFFCGGMCHQRSKLGKKAGSLIFDV